MRIIDADALRQDWLENGENEYVYDTNAMLDSIDKQPTVDAVPVVHGRWIYVDGKGSHAEYKCNQCRTHVCFDEQIDGLIPAYKHCPNCGAKMDLEEENETN